MSELDERPILTSAVAALRASGPLVAVAEGSGEFDGVAYQSGLRLEAYPDGLVVRPPGGREYAVREDVLHKVTIAPLADGRVRMEVLFLSRAGMLFPPLAIELDEIADRRLYETVEGWVRARPHEWR